MEITSNVAKSGIKDYLFSGITFLISIILLLLVAYPSYTSLSEIKANNATLEGKLQQMQLKVERLQKLSAIAGTLDENLVLAKKAFPDERDIPALLSEVQQISMDTGLQLETLQFGGSSGASQASSTEPQEAAVVPVESKIGVQTSSTGSYVQILNYLQVLENARRIVQFDNLKISSKGKDDYTSYTVSLSIIGFFSKPKDYSQQAPEAAFNVALGDSELASALDSLKSFKEYETKPLTSIIKEETVPAQPAAPVTPAPEPAPAPEP